MSGSSQLEAVASWPQLWDAWARVRARASAPGIDRVSVADYQQDVDARLDSLSARLLDGSYRPRPARRLRLPEAPDRPIAVSTVEDRIVQRAIAVVLSPVLEPRFSSCAYGYRQGRSVRDAVQAVQHHLDLGRRWFARADVEKFFDRIDRDRLLLRLDAFGVARDVVALVRQLLGAQVIDGASAFDTGVGVAQGSALSPLLSNVYLDPVDRRMEALGHPFLRYADDLLLLAESEAGAADGLAELSDAVDAEGLRLGARKTRRGHLGAGFVFLGVHFDASGHRLSGRALEALDEVAGERADDPSALEELAEEWERWYGAVPGDALTSLPALAAAALRADRVDDRASVDRLAARRNALVGVRLQGAVHLALCAVWGRAASQVAARALVIDAGCAVRAGLTPGQQRTLAHLLGIGVGELGGLAGSPDRVAAHLAALGAVALGDAVRGAERRPRRRPLRQVEDDTVEWLLARSRGRGGMYAEEQRDRRGHLRLLEQGRPLTADVVRAHLAGRHRVGCYPVRPDGMVLLACLRVTVRRDAMLPPWALGAGELTSSILDRWRALEGLAHDFAVALVGAAGALGVTLWLEDDGGMARTVWLLLSAPVHLRHARAFLIRVLADAGDAPSELHCEVVPPTDRVRRGPGPVLLLPLGVHPRSGDASRLIDTRGASVSLPAEDALTPPAAITELTRRGPLAPSRAGTLPDVGPLARQVLEGCAVARALAEKADRLRHLAGEERRTLVEALGHLPEAERAPTLEVVLGPVGYTPHAVARTLARLSDLPLSCHKIRKRHAALTAEVGCDCRFRGLHKGTYPTPVLHVLRVDQIPALKVRMRARPPARRDDGERPWKAASPSPAAPDAAVERAWAKVQSLERHLDDAQRGLRRTRAELHALLDRAGGDRARVSGGWVVRRRTDRGARFAFEEDP